MKLLHTKILQLAETRDLGKMTYREIGSLLGNEHPYQIQYNIKQLVAAGRLIQNKRTKSIALAEERKSSSLLSIPIMGSVSCGIAVDWANNEEQGFVAVSPSLVNARQSQRLFALKANGNSMNQANIAGKNVEHGDYVIVRQTEWGNAKSGEYVVSLIEDCANLKRLQIDHQNSRLILLSESNDSFTPMIIAKEDLEYYRILGTAVDVIKAIP